MRRYFPFQTENSYLKVMWAMKMQLPIKLLLGIPTAQVLTLHEELRKVESALLTQARTKRIGLAEFLHRHKVPGFPTATYLCGEGYETPRHMALFCTYEADRRHYLHAGKKRTYTQIIGTREGAKHFVRWMMYSGRLAQFSLAKRLLHDSK
jgi:hypothetical protein